MNFKELRLAISYALGTKADWENGTCREVVLVNTVLFSKDFFEKSPDVLNIAIAPELFDAYPFEDILSLDDQVDELLYNLKKEPSYNIPEAKKRLIDLAEYLFEGECVYHEDLFQGTWEDYVHKHEKGSQE